MSLFTQISHRYKLNQSYVSRVLQQWGYSRKKTDKRQINKFSVANCFYYVQYLLEIKCIPWGSLKFMDESSFSSRGE